MSDQSRNEIDRAIAENANIIRGTSDPAHPGESVSVSRSDGLPPVRARAFRPLPGGTPVVAFQDPNGGWNAIPEEVQGRDDVASRDRQGTITRTYGQNSRRTRKTYFFVGVPRYVKGARVLVAFSFPVEKDDPVELACPNWIPALQDEKAVCIPVPSLPTHNEYVHESFQECRAENTYPCPKEDPPGGDDGLPPKPPPGTSGSMPPPPTTWTDEIPVSRYSSFSEGIHADKIYLLRFPSGNIDVCRIAFASYPDPKDQRRMLYGRVLMASGDVVVGLASRVFPNCTVLDEVGFFDPRTSPRRNEEVSCGTTLDFGQVETVFRIQRTVTYDNSGVSSASSEYLGKYHKSSSRTSQNPGQVKVSVASWVLPEKFDPAMCGTPGTGGGEDEGGSGGGGGGGGGGTSPPPDPPEPEPPPCFREEGNPDNIARKFFVGAEEEIGRPEELIEISDQDEYKIFLEATTTGWSAKLKYGATGNAEKRERKYCKKDSFGSSSRGWQDPIAEGLEVYSAQDIDELDADPCVKENTGLDVNIVQDGDRKFKYSVDRRQIIKAIHSLGNIDTPLEDELKRIIPAGSSSMKDPIPVVVTKEEINAEKTEQDEACTLFENSAETLPGAIYRIAYEELFPEDAIVSQNGCPVGEFDIEQLSPLILPEDTP